MAINDEKDSVNMCKTSFTRVCTYKHWKNEKRRWLHLNYGIRANMSACVICIQIFFLTEAQINMTISMEVSNQSGKCTNFSGQ